MVIAIFIIMISMLASLTSLTVTMRTSMENEVRDVSTKIANMTAEALLSLPFTTTFTDAQLTPGVHVRAAGDAAQNARGIPDTTQAVRNFMQTFVIQWVVTTQTPNSMQIDIEVTYTYRGKTYTKNSTFFRNTTV